MNIRPTTLLARAQESARGADIALDPAELGTSRYTRHSFARSFLRRAAEQRWQVDVERWNLDDKGCGTAVFRIAAQDHIFHFVLFSKTLAESERTDRVIAKSWDLTAALVDGEIDETHVQKLSEQVPRQEQGRADEHTLLWTRANRSGRYFDYVVDRLASGAQPDIEAMGDSSYVLRSTAFYSNGKFGLADFDRFDDDHPLHLPYRAHMLAAWLLREFSFRLVEHCAVARNPQAATLSGDWRRFFGLGNATGLGMVPYVVNHPQVLDAWCAARELPLSYCLAVKTEPSCPGVRRVAQLLERARRHYGEQTSMVTEPFIAGPQLAEQLGRMSELVDEYATAGTVLGASTDTAWRALHDAAASIGAECRSVMDSIIVEDHPEIDGDIERLLRCDQGQSVHAAQTCGQLLESLQNNYNWVRRYDFSDPAQQANFWFSSADNEEPRRGRRGTDPGENVEHPIDIARAVARLWDDLALSDSDTTVAEFLLEYPWNRGAVGRVQALTGLPYSECRTNLLADDFVPLNIQRFQLAQYGMENYSPQSTDWLRVVLYSGAPRTEDVARGIDDDWIFNCKPGKDV